MARLRGVLCPGSHQVGIKISPGAEVLILSSQVAGIHFPLLLSVQSLLSEPVTPPGQVQSLQLPLLLPLFLGWPAAPLGRIHVMILSLPR